MYVEDKVFVVSKFGYMYILALNDLSQWHKVDLPQSHGVHPLIVPFSPTRIAVIGGWIKGKGLNKVTLFETHSMSMAVAESQTDDDLGV